MRVLSLRNTAIILAAGIGLSGCATYGPYGGLGVGVGYGNGGYGYDPYYGGGYYGGGYGSYGYNSPYGYGGYGYGSPYYGWNDGFYYPGSGYYVYDQYRNRHRWTDAQRRYWEQRQREYRDRNRVGFLGENWRDYHRDRTRTQATSSNAERLRSRDLVRTNTVRSEQSRAERRQSWSDRRQARTERTESRQSKRDSIRRSRDD